jgi:hypothetical protein
MQEHAQMFQEVTQTSAGKYVPVSGQFRHNQQLHEAKDNLKHNGADPHPT